METGHIRIGIDRKVYFEPDGLEKPDRPSFYVPGYGHREQAFKIAMAEYEASKQLIKVSNELWIEKNSTNNKYIFAIIIREKAEFIKDNTPCKAETEDGGATIVELIK